MKNPAAAFSALAAILVALGVDIPDEFVDHVVAAIGAVSGLVGFVLAWWR